MSTRYERHKSLVDMLLRDLTPATPQKRCVSCEQLFHGCAELCVPCQNIWNEAKLFGQSKDEILN